MSKTFAGLGGVFFVLLWIAAIVGWVMNLVKIFSLWNDSVTGELIIRIAGVPFAPIGAIAGWF